MFIIGDAYDLWDRCEIWEQLTLARPIWILDPPLVDIIGEQGTIKIDRSSKRSVQSQQIFNN